MRWICWFSEIGITDVPLVGGKNASLGEMLRELMPLGVRVPNGYAVTAEAYRYFLDANDLKRRSRDILTGWQRGDVQDLVRRSRRIRNLILKGAYPSDLEAEIVAAYRKLSDRAGAEEALVAVRSSATAEDLPTASFAGQQETYLHVHGEAELLESVKKALASLFTSRAISYREDMGFDHFQVALSVGVQQMVHADLASSGVLFTLDTESGFRDVVFITSSWGLGENIVQGRVIPDEFYVHKPTLRQDYQPLIGKRLGAKEFKLIYDETGHRLKNIAATAQERARFSLSDDEVLQPARWGMEIEATLQPDARAAQRPWTSSGPRTATAGSCLLSRPAQKRSIARSRRHCCGSTHLKERGTVLAEGLAVGEAIATGPARVIQDPRQMRRVSAGRGADHRDHQPRLGADHEAGCSDRDGAWRAHLARRDRRT